MSKKQHFEVFSPEKQKQYEREVRLQHGPDKVNESVKRWNSYSEAQRQAIGDEGNQVYSDLVEAIEVGKQPQDEDVQKILQSWHEHIRYFYEPTLDILRGLGETYNSHPDFISNFKKLHPNLPEFLREGISQYVDELEYREIERMLSEDEALRGRGQT